MKRLHSKRGFTLVECIIAMAILAIMSLLLTMMLGITAKANRANRSAELELDEQVANIAQGNVSSTETISDADIIFETQQPNETAVAIQGDVAKNVDNDENAIPLGAAEYDYGNYFDELVPDESSDDDDITNGYGSQSSKVYGGADLSGNTVYVSEITKTESADSYDVTWRIAYTAEAVATEKSIKFVLPSGSKFKSSSSIKEASILMISDRTLRIEPKNVGPDEVNVTFTISKEDFNSDSCKSLQYYLLGVDDNASPVSINIRG